MIDVDARCACGDCCGFGRPEQSRAYAASGNFTSYIDGRAMLVLIDQVRRKT
jgi:hypothetical protein